MGAAPFAFFRASSAASKETESGSLFVALFQ
jgi:hypothetical protein